MTRFSKIALIFLVGIPLALIVCSLLWQRYGEYYWNTSILTVYQKGKSIHLCGESNEVSMEWLGSIENEEKVNAVIFEARAGVPITIVGRGVFSQGKELEKPKVWFEEFHTLAAGENERCEEKVTNK